MHTLVLRMFPVVQVMLLQLQITVSTFKRRREISVSNG